MGELPKTAADLTSDWLGEALGAQVACSPMSLIGTFDSGNEPEAAMTEAFTVRMMRHAVESDAQSVL